MKIAVFIDEESSDFRDAMPHVVKLTDCLRESGHEVNIFATPSKMNEAHKYKLPYSYMLDEPLSDILREHYFDYCYVMSRSLFSSAVLSSSSNRILLFLVDDSSRSFIRSKLQNIRLRILLTLSRKDIAFAANGHRAASRYLKYVPTRGLSQIFIVSADVDDGSDFPAVDRSFARREYGLAEDEFVILTPGDVVSDNGHNDIIDALQSVPDHMASRIHWWVIGGHPDEKFSKYICERSEDLRNRSWFFGQVDRLEYSKRISAADILCLPAKGDIGRDNASTKFREAAVIGLPAIGFPFDNAPRSIEAGMNTVAMETKSSSTLLDEILSLMSDRAYRTKVGKQALNRSKSSGWSFVVQETLSKESRTSTTWAEM